MIIPIESKNLPPKAFLMQVLNDVAKVYVFLWEKKDGMNMVRLNWEEILKIYNKNYFRTNLRKLNNEGLLSYEEAKDGISIELVDWEDVAGSI